MRYSSYLELSKSALKNNFEYIRNMLGNTCQLSHVVKGNAYGHGIDTYVPMACEFGANHFSTFDAIEAEEVHDITNGEVTVLIMGMIGNDELDWAIENDIEFFVFDLDRVNAAIVSAKKQGKKARIHVELETGMNRTGFDLENLPALIRLLKKESDSLELKGICTHYAGAESYANLYRVNEQYDRFNKAITDFEQQGVKAQKLHTACSAAAIRLPHTQMDMARIGILQYGFWPSTETYIQTIKPGRNQLSDPLKRVLSWKSQVMNVKKVSQGEYIGYGNSYLAAHDMEVATVPVGYSHGFSRSLSNQGRALVRGVRVPVVGTVNMNMMLVDVSQVANIEIGDEVVLIGKQDELSISVSSFSDFSDQLNYELLTRLPHDIPRYIVK